MRFPALIALLFALPAFAAEPPAPQPTNNNLLPAADMLTGNPDPAEGDIFQPGLTVGTQWDAAAPVSTLDDTSITDTPPAPLGGK